MPKRIDLTGKTFGYLTVERWAGQTSARNTLWWCVCACGTRKRMLSANLRSGRAVSCGCRQRALIALATTTHNLSRTRIYGRWQNMIARCSNAGASSFDRYGGRGISVCDRWQFGENGKTGIECFIEDMGMPPFSGASLDRIDTNGNYEPGNVRWATHAQQARNTSVNVVNADQVADIKARLERGETTAAICKAFGISRGQLSHIRTGQSWADIQPARSIA